MLNELHGCEVTALCETSIENIVKQPRAFLPSLVTADYDAFLAEPLDAVVIATPAKTHFELAMRALERGKHVLIEKPFTTNIDDALTLITAARHRGLTLAVGHTYVYHPAVEYLRGMIERNELGRLRYIHTARLNFGILQPDVDVLWDLAPHDLSILLYILQQEPEVAAARGASCINPPFCEIAHLDLQFPEGPFAHVYVSWLEPTKVRRFTFVGEEKTAVYDDVAQGEMIRIYDKSIKLTTSNGHQGMLAPQYIERDITIPHLGNGEPLKNEISHFLDCIRSDAPAISDGWEGLKVVRILEAAQQALYGGDPLEARAREPIALREAAMSIAPREPLS